MTKSHLYWNTHCPGGGGDEGVGDAKAGHGGGGVKLKRELGLFSGMAIIVGKDDTDASQ